MKPSKTKILEMLKYRPYGMEDLCRAIDAEPRTVYRYLQDLIDDGEPIIRLGIDRSPMFVIPRTLEY